jgi:hypothetical protein
MSLMSICMSKLKSKQLLNFRNTLFILQNGFNNKPNLPLTLRQWRSTRWINVCRSFTSQSGGKTGLITREIVCFPCAALDLCAWFFIDAWQWQIKFNIFRSILCLGISIITWVIILKQLFASGSWILVNIPLDFVSGNIHQYSLRLRRIIVKYF